MLAGSFTSCLWMLRGLQPWLHQRRNWREWAPQRKEGRTPCQTSHPLLAGNSFCAPLCRALLPTPKLCLSGCTVFSPKRTLDLQVPFHQIPPSSDSLSITRWWLQWQCCLLLREGRYQGEPGRSWRGPCPVGWSGIKPASERLPSTKLELCCFMEEAARKGLGCWEISALEMAFVYGGTQTHPTLPVLTLAGWCSSPSLRWRASRPAAAFVVCANTSWFYISAARVQSKGPVNSDFWIFWW